ncbi:hypothetical protein BJ912DRAFT_936744 [Pholiota molesta]|nr:hypothetical protein BJ912DRAFT_936744 [Pholiota molesta]
MLIIAAPTADKSLLRIAAELANAGKRTMDKLFPPLSMGIFSLLLYILTSANAHARHGRPHLTTQVFDGPGTFLGGVHFNLDEASTPTYRAYNSLKPKGFQRTADRRAHKNFLGLKTYTVLRCARSANGTGRHGPLIADAATPVVRSRTLCIAATPRLPPPIRIARSQQLTRTTTQPCYCDTRRSPSIIFLDVDSLITGASLIIGARNGANQLKEANKKDDQCWNGSMNDISILTRRGHQRPPISAQRQLSIVHGLFIATYGRAEIWKRTRWKFPAYELPLHILYLPGIEQGTRA